jgi:hypothetical protein
VNHTQLPKTENPITNQVSTDENCRDAPHLSDYSYAVIFAAPPRTNLL